MDYIARIKRLSDGLIREVRKSDWQNSSGFWWTDGNYGCDCNRDLEFMHAADEQSQEDASCGDMKKYVVQIVLDDKSIPLDEFNMAPDADRSDAITHSPQI